MERLDGSNYAAWSAVMQEQLQQRGLWGVVDAERTTTPRAKNDKHRVERTSRALVESLEPHVLRDALMSAPPANLWAVLERRYRAQPVGNVMDKAFECFDAVFDEADGKLEAHVERMERSMQALVTMGVEVPEGLQVLILLHSLKSGGRAGSVVDEMRRLPSLPTKNVVVDKLRECCATEIVATSSSSSSRVDHAGTCISASSWCWVSAANTTTVSASAPPFSEDTIRAFARAMHQMAPTESLVSERTEFASWDNVWPTGKPPTCEPAPSKKSCTCNCSKADA